MTQLVLTQDAGHIEFIEAVLERRSMEAAERHMEKGAIGITCNLSNDRALSFLPSSKLRQRTYFTLFPDGRIKVPQAEDGRPYRRNVVGMPDQSDFPLHREMTWLEDVLVAIQRTHRLPMAHAFILRPQSLIVLRVPSRDFPQGSAIVFRPDATGHDILQEVTAVTHDFPNRFDIAA